MLTYTYPVESPAFGLLLQNTCLRGVDRVVSRFVGRAKGCSQSVVYCPEHPLRYQEPRLGRLGKVLR